MRDLPIHAAVARAREHQGPDKPSRGILWTLGLGLPLWAVIVFTVVSILRAV